MSSGEVSALLFTIQCILNVWVSKTNWLIRIIHSLQACLHWLYFSFNDSESFSSVLNYIECIWFPKKNWFIKVICCLFSIVGLYVFDSQKLFILNRSVLVALFLINLKETLHCFLIQSLSICSAYFSELHMTKNRGEEAFSLSYPVHS